MKDMSKTLAEPQKALRTLESEKENTSETPPRVFCFVCSGNTCRSPMAEAAANILFRERGITAVSAGLCVPAPAPISPKAVLALKTRGYLPDEAHDYRRHVARQLDAGIMASVERVYGMTPTHSAAILSAFPEFASKLFPLGVTVPDPYGGDLDTYLAALDTIVSALEKLE